MRGRLRPHRHRPDRRPRVGGHRRYLCRRRVDPRTAVPLGRRHAGGLHPRRARRAVASDLFQAERPPRAQARTGAGPDNRPQQRHLHSRHPRQDHHLDPDGAHHAAVGNGLLGIPRRHLEQLSDQLLEQSRVRLRGDRGRRVRPLVPDAAPVPGPHHGHGRRPSRHLRHGR